MAAHQDGFQQQQQGSGTVWCSAITPSAWKLRFQPKSNLVPQSLPEEPHRAHPAAPGDRAPEGSARIPCVPEAAGTSQMVFPAPRQALCSPLPSLARDRDPLAAAFQTGDPICTLGLSVDGVFVSPRNYCSFQAALGPFFLPTPPVSNATDT